MKNVHVLMEEAELTAGMREANIIAISNDKNKLIKKLKETLKEDSYGIFEKNGVYFASDTHIQSEYSETNTNCFVMYYISTKELIWNSEYKRRHIMSKKILIIRDSIDNDPMVGLIVDANLDAEDAQNSINEILRKLRKLYPDEWCVSDIVERLEFEYEEFPIDSVYV